MANVQKILFITPTLLSARNLIMTGVCKALSKNADITVVLERDTAEQIINCLNDNSIKYIFMEDVNNISPPLFRKIKFQFTCIVQKLLGAGFSFGGCAYRFNEIHGFIGHAQKKKMSTARKKKEERAGNYVSARYGFPFPRSRALYRIAMKIYWHRIFINPSIEAFFAKENPDCIFVGQIQDKRMRSFILCAKQNDKCTIGYVASWDQPSTKGPIPGCLDKVIVQNEWMRQQVLRYHHIPENKISVVGWPQMDVYSQLNDTITIDALKDFYKIPNDSKVILYALNAERLGRDEPNVVKKLQEWMYEQKNDVHLILRPHPKDKTAKSRYAPFINAKNIHYCDQELESLASLRDQISIADVVLNSVGSFSLDATAMDKPFIYIGFELAHYADRNESLQKWYELEHLRSVVETGAVGPAFSFDELTHMINEAFMDCSVRSLERKELLKKHLEPLDGGASQRLSDLILRQICEDNYHA